MTIDLKDIPSLLSESSCMVAITKGFANTSICACCGTVAETGMNITPIDSYTDSPWNYKGRIKASRWNTTVVPSTDRDNHIIISDAELEFLLEWNDK